MKILNKIVAILVDLELIISISLCVLAMWISPKNNLTARRVWARSQRFFLRYKLEMVGEFNPKAKMLIINHQSMLDIIALEAIYPDNLCWVSKKEIGDLPIVGKILSLPKMISIDRSDPRALAKLMAEAKQRIAEGRILAIFPEGTRGRGDKLLKFQGGAKIIAEKLNLNVQPIVIKGSRYILDTQNTSVHSGKLKIICMDMIDKSESDWLNSARSKMQRVLDEN